ATFSKHLKISDPAVAEEGYIDIVRNTDRVPYAGPDGLRNIQRFMKLRTPAAEKIKINEVIDDSILKGLERSGFVARLYESYGMKYLKAEHRVYRRRHTLLAGSLYRPCLASGERPCRDQEDNGKYIRFGERVAG